MYVCMGGGGGRGRERGRERERESVCVCVDGFIVECPLPPLPPSVHLALRANDQVRCFINIHLHYITLHYLYNTYSHTKQMQRYPPLWRLHSHIVDFNDGVCHAMQISTAESNPDMELLSQQMFCLSPDGLARANKVTNNDKVSSFRSGPTCYMKH